MTPQTTTVFSGTSPSGMLSAYVERRAGELTLEHPRVSACRVAFESPDSRGAQRVRVAVSFAGDAVFVSAIVGAGVRSGDPYMLIDRAFGRMHAKLRNPRTGRSSAMAGVIAH